MRLIQQSRSKIRPILSFKDTETILRAFILSCSDYCNSLQIVSNSATKILTKIKKQDHITPVLAALHWLPVLFKIDFGILLNTFKALHGLVPWYISNLVLYVQIHTLRSSNRVLFSVPGAVWKERGTGLLKQGSQGCGTICPKKKSSSAELF